MTAGAGLEPWQEHGFGLYVHWPFCTAKCPYCDFNSHVRSGIDEAAWAAAYQREIARYGAEVPGRVLGSIYLGGGTPSLMSVDTVAAILDAARATWILANDVEITLEANPGSVETERFRGYHAAGVNRVSLGVQALNDEDLRRLGRIHSAADALRALETANLVFDRVSFDLIYARQGQSVGQWRDELGRALAMAPDHLSLYHLTIEPETAFARRKERGLLRGLPDEDLSAELFDLTQEATSAAGLAAYEVSNHAGSGARSRHNLTYWRGGDWVGVGPGAHGRLTMAGLRIATAGQTEPEAWLRNAGSRSVELREFLDDTEVLEELIMSGLRTDEGVTRRRIMYYGGGASIIQSASVLIAEGWLEQDPSILRLTRQGRPLLDAVLRRLLT